MKVKIEDLKKELEKQFESYEKYITKYYNYLDNIYNIIYYIADNKVDTYMDIKEKLMKNKSIMLKYLAYYILQNEGIEELEENKATKILMINFDNIGSITKLEDELHEIIKENEV